MRLANVAAVDAVVLYNYPVQNFSFAVVLIDLSSTLALLQLLLEVFPMPLLQLADAAQIFLPSDSGVAAVAVVRSSSKLQFGFLCLQVQP